MQKEALRQLKRIKATPRMVRLAKENNQETVYRTEWREYHRDTVYDIMVRCQTREMNGDRILMVCIFFPEWIVAGSLTPA